MAVCSLWHCPAGHPGWLLATTLPCGARTFLGGGVSPTDATARPTRPSTAKSTEGVIKGMVAAMEFRDVAVLLAAGVGAGAVNAAAGGGSLITFPALVAVGLPPKLANVTNSIAVFPGYLASVAGSFRDLGEQGRTLVRLLPTIAVGTAAGCALLLVTPPTHSAEWSRSWSLRPRGSCSSRIRSRPWWVIPPI